MVVDPWGKVVAERAAGAGVVMADIDPTFQAKMRARCPLLRTGCCRGAGARIWPDRPHLHP